MRTSASLSVTASMLTMALVISCSQAENKNALPKPTVAPTQTAATTVSTPASPTIPPFVSNAVAPSVSRIKSLPAEGGDRPTEAEVDGYPYSYKKDGEKTVATFDAKLLPWDSHIVAGAIRDVIYRSYGDKVDSAPHIEGNGSGQTIRIADNKHQYVVVPVSEPTGEIHSLIITQLN
jgi:guanyl-specific ribonuclease Sa